MKKVLVTGANGFVGQDLCQKLIQENHEVIAVTRSPFELDGVQNINISSIDSETEWANILEGVETVFHLAARVHVMQEKDQNPLDAFCRINVDGTEKLAKSCQLSGVNHFIYLSSIKVNGEHTLPGSPFQIDNKTNAQDPYGQSKYLAEQALEKLSDQRDMKISIVRPPLVYGPGVKANFLAFLKLAHKNVPVPFGSLNNKRSMIYLENLTHFLMHLDAHQNQNFRRYLISDPETFSVKTLYEELAELFGHKPRSFPVPIGLLKFAGRLTGKTAQIQRLCDYLEIDLQKTIQETGWEAPFNNQEGLKKTVNWYKSQIN